MGNSKFEFRPIGLFQYIEGYCLETEEASETLSRWDRDSE
jgi:hypothetical protein